MESKEFYQTKQTAEEAYFLKMLSVKSDIRKHKFTPVNHYYDVSFRSGGTWASKNSLCIGEIKVRKDSYTKDFFLNNGAMINYDKFEKLAVKKIELDDKHNTDIKVYYFHYTTDGYCLVYLLKELHTYDFTFESVPINMYNPKLKIKRLVTKLMNPVEIIKMSKNE